MRAGPTPLDSATWPRPCAARPSLTPSLDYRNKTAPSPRSPESESLLHPPILPTPPSPNNPIHTLPSNKLPDRLQLSVPPPHLAPSPDYGNGLPSDLPVTSFPSSTSPLCLAPSILPPSPASALLLGWGCALRQKLNSLVDLRVLQASPPP